MDEFKYRHNVRPTRNGKWSRFPFHISRLMILIVDLLLQEIRTLSMIAWEITNELDVIHECEAVLDRLDIQAGGIFCFNFYSY